MTVGITGRGEWGGGGYWTWQWEAGLPRHDSLTTGRQASKNQITPDRQLHIVITASQPVRIALLLEC